MTAGVERVQQTSQAEPVKVAGIPVLEPLECLALCMIGIPDNPSENRTLPFRLKSLEHAMRLSDGTRLPCVAAVQRLMEIKVFYQLGRASTKELEQQGQMDVRTDQFGLSRYGTEVVDTPEFRGPGGAIQKSIDKAVELLGKVERGADLPPSHPGHINPRGAAEEIRTQKALIKKLSLYLLEEPNPEKQGAAGISPDLLEPLNTRTNGSGKGGTGGAGGGSKKTSTKKKRGRPAKKKAAEEEDGPSVAGNGVDRDSGQGTPEGAVHVATDGKQNVVNLPPEGGVDAGYESELANRVAGASSRGTAGEGG